MSNLELTIAIPLISLALSVIVNWLANILPEAESEENLVSEDTPDISPIFSLFTILNKKDSTHPHTLGRWRYLLVELVSIAIGFYLATRYSEDVVSIGVLLFYLEVFLLIAVIDIEHRLILDVVVLPIFAVAFFEVLLNDRLEFTRGLQGYALAQIIMLGFYLVGVLFVRFMNRNEEDRVTETAFGFGDVTLATLCGFIVGSKLVFHLIMYTALIGGAMAFVLVVDMTIRKQKALTRAFAYGPAILLGTTIVLLYGDQILANLAG